jgi:outer membrane protein assembly factor BamA
LPGVLSRVHIRFNALLMRLALTLGLLLALGGCHRQVVPVCAGAGLQGCPIESVRVRGSKAVKASDVRAHLATAETQRVLAGILEGVPVLGAVDAVSVEYETFDEAVFDRDRDRLLRYYQSRGYYAAKVVNTQATRTKRGRVRISFEVEEGLPIRIHQLDSTWTDWSPLLPAALARAVANASAGIAVGTVWDEERHDAVKKTIRQASADLGFPLIDVQATVDIDTEQRQARITMRLRAGPQCRFGAVRFEGLQRLPETPLRQALGFREGQAFSQSALESAEIALRRFGVLSSVALEPQWEPGGSEAQSLTVPIVVRVREALLQSVQIGVGGEVGARIEAHLLAGWESRNLLGGLRNLSLSVRPAAMLHPIRLDLESLRVVGAATRVLPQLRSEVRFRQPVPRDPRTAIVLETGFNVVRLMSTEALVDNPADLNLVAYRQVLGRVGVERAFWKGRVETGLYYDVRWNDPFSFNRPLPPAGYEGLLLSQLELALALDLRRDRAGKPDRMDPAKGVYLGSPLQFAGGFLGGSLDDVRWLPELRAYAPISDRVVLAFHSRFGLLFPRNYGSPKACTVGDTACAEAATRDLQFNQLRGFFLGGAFSNRGYPYNGVGPRAVVPALFLVSSRAQEIPIGGATSWEASLEFRIALIRALSTALFIDAGDVTTGVAAFRLSHPHISAGAGLRYLTPLGPIRLDLGVRIPCLQELGQCRPESEQSLPKVGAVPMAVSLVFGQPF